MRTKPILAGVAVGATLGLAGLAALDAATETADAQAGFAVTAGQLQVNQRISQAAVRRSNEALNLLRPVREAPAGASGQGLAQSGGVQPGTGTGWQPEQIDVTALRAALGSGEGATGAPGPPGPPGPAGPRGETGPPGVTGLQRAESEVFTFPSAFTAARTVTCPAGTVVTGGGVTQTNAAGDAQAGSTVFTVHGSGPLIDTGAEGWFAVVSGKASPFDISFVVFALCATTG